MAIRIECDLDGLTSNWCDVADGWTRREVQELVDVQDETFYDLLRRKVTACHIELSNGVTITDPQHITDDALLDADIALLGWLGRTLPLAVARRRVLGNASARLSSPVNA